MLIPKHNQVVGKIIELSYDHHLSTNDIQGLIWTQFNENLSTDFINSVIAAYMQELDDQADDDLQHLHRDYVKVMEQDIEA